MGDQVVDWASLQLGSEEELNHRLSFLSPSDAMRGVFINGVLEVVRQLGGEEAARHCLEELGEKKLMDFFNYPMSTFIRMTYAAAHFLGLKNGGFERAMREMGYQAVKNFQPSTVGRVMQVLSQGSPAGLLESLPSATRTMTAGGECTVRLSGPNSGIYSVTRDFMPPPYTEGAMQALFETTKAKGLKVRAKRLGPFDTEYEISWD